MIESERLEDVYSYKILDTEPEEALDELVEIAAAIFDTPISLITIIDQNRQWFKSKKGFDPEGTSREVSFCKYALPNPDEVFIVEDPLNDERFRNNPLVTDDPNIRFYAGAPLVSKGGNVLGTVCVLDNETKKFSDNQKRGLQLIAKKVMQYLETRKLLLDQKNVIAQSASNLIKLTDHAPGVIFQFKMDTEGNFSFPFISKGIKEFHPHISLKQVQSEPSVLLNAVHTDDLDFIKESLVSSYESMERWDIEYRIIDEKGKMRWHRVHANPEKTDDGGIVWFGTFQDITKRKEYLQSVEKMLFDISHVLRRPVSTLLGISRAANEEDPGSSVMKDNWELISKVAEEMDTYLKQLNKEYSLSRQELTGNSTSR